MKFGPWGRRRREQDLDAEIRSHFRMAIDDRMERGETALGAEQAAHREFGNVDLVKEVARDMWGWTLLEQLRSDARYALRVMLRNPRFTIAAIFTLALGIGANSAIFSMVHALILRPYTFRDLDRLVLVREGSPGENAAESRVTAGDAADLSRELGVFDSVAVYRGQEVSLSGSREVNPVISAAVSPSFFEMLGVQPMLGRAWARDEDQPGRGQVAVLSYALWVSRFGGGRDILGKTIQLNARGYTVIGVMPAGFNYPVPSELWTPLVLRPEERSDRTAAAFSVLGRLQGGISVAEAGSALQGFSKRLRERYPLTNAGRSLTLIRLREELYQFTIPLFSSLELAAVFVLVLACANLMNLLMARMAGREKELAVRVALGANPRRLGQLILIESMLLALIAGAAALAASCWSVTAIRTSISEDYTRWVPGWDRIRVDPAVVAFALLASVAVGALIGMVTAARGAQADLNAKLKDGDRAGTAAGPKHRLRNTLVVVQMVLAMVLLVGAALMIQGFLHVTDVYRTLQPATVLIFETPLPESRYPDHRRVASFYEQALRDLRALPKVEAVAVTTNLPASNVANDRQVVAIAGRPSRRVSELPLADVQSVSPGYFGALRIPVIRGRALAVSDSADAPRVVVVSQTAAGQFWPQQDPLGRKLKLGSSGSAGEWLTVVGVCRDVKQNWWNASPPPTLYLPYQQAPQRAMHFALRVAAGPNQYAAAVRDVVERLDPQLALTDMKAYDKEIADSLAVIRIMGMLMTIFGGVALALAAVGTYGLVAYGVSRRTHEFGIRVALGASRLDVLTCVLGEALALSAIGAAVSTPLSFALSKLMDSSVFGLVRFRPIILMAFAGLLVFTSLAASFFPALRATRVDPLRALRHE
ncbi:MAG TPA: ABC transporter permease [Bryobacteraceae bacterium]|nr:ABC transporter permease [Bryobacteraceae bacterium]